MVTGSLPKVSGTILTDKITGTDVSVYRDGYSVPHIICSNDYDLFFAQGFATAQDRLWQMDMYRRMAAGKLAEILGSKAVESDIFMRRIGFNNKAERIYDSLSQKSKEILQAYSDGVNLYITLHKKSLPLEFKLLYYSSDKWQPWHSLLILYFYEWKLNTDYSDKIFKNVFHEKGVYKRLKITTSGSTGKFNDNLYTDFLISTRHFLKDILPDEKGCNFAMYMPAKTTETNSPFIMGNFVSGNTIPVPWYQIHLASESINVQGLTIPGIPLVLTGQNRAVAWIFSGMEKGYMDLVLSDTKEQYYEKFTEKIKSLSDSVNTITVERTLKSSVIFTHPENGQKLLLIQNRDLSVDFFKNLYNICRSTDLHQLVSSASPLTRLKYTFLAADSSGNHVVIGNIPDNINYNTEILKTDSSLSIMKIKDIMSNVISNVNYSISRKIASLLKTSPGYKENKTFKTAVDALEQWNGSMKASKPEPTIINTFLFLLTQKTIKPLFGNDLYQIYASLNPFPYTLIEKWLSEQITADSDNFAKQLILSSFSTAIDSLSQISGNDIRNWSWGKFHTVTFYHMLNWNPLLSNALNLGPFPVNGSVNTIFNSGSSVSQSPDACSFNSARVIFDLKNPDNSLLTISTGQSGQPVDIHYKDQINLSVKNLFHPVLYDTVKVKSSGWKCLTLKKERQ